LAVCRRSNVFSLVIIDSLSLSFSAVDSTRGA
jgi:hypothetical protein